MKKSSYYIVLALLATTTLSVSKASDIFFGDSSVQRIIDTDGIVYNGGTNTGVFSANANLFLQAELLDQDPQNLGKPAATVELRFANAVITNITGTGTTASNWSAISKGGFKISANNPHILGTISAVSNLNLNNGDVTWIQPTGIQGQVALLDNIIFQSTKRSDNPILYIDSSAATGDIQFSVTGLISSPVYGSGTLNLKTVKDRNIILEASTNATGISNLITAGDGKVSINNDTSGTTNSFYIKNSASFGAAETILNNGDVELQSGQDQKLQLLAGKILTVNSATNFTADSLELQEGSTANFNGPIDIDTLVLSGSTANFSNSEHQAVTNIEVNAPTDPSRISTISGAIGLNMLSLNGGIVSIPNANIKAVVNITGDNTIKGTYNISDTPTSWNDITRNETMQVAGNTYQASIQAPGFYKAAINAYSAASASDVASNKEYLFPSSTGFDFKQNSSLTLDSLPNASLIFEADSKMIIDGDVDFPQPFAWYSSLPLSKMFIKGSSIDRTVKIGDSVPLNITQLLPFEDGAHYVIFDNTFATTMPQLGDATHKFKAVGIEGNMTIDAGHPYLLGNTIFANNILVLGDVTFSAGILPVSGLIIGKDAASDASGKFTFDITTDKSLVEKVTTIMPKEDGIGIVRLQDTGEVAATVDELVTLPTIGASDAKLESLELDRIYAQVGTNAPNISKLVMKDSYLALGDKVIEVDSAIFTGDNANAIETTILGRTNGKLRITGANSSGNINLVVTSSSHIPSGEFIVIEAVGGGDLSKLRFESVAADKLDSTNTVALASTPGVVKVTSTISVPVKNNTIFSDLSFYVKDGKLIIRTATNPGKVEEIVTEVQKFIQTPEGKQITKLLGDNIDNHEQAGRILAVIKDLIERPGQNNIQDFIASFTHIQENLVFRNLVLSQILLIPQGLLSSIQNDPIKTGHNVLAAGEADDDWNLWVKTCIGRGNHAPTSNSKGFSQSMSGVIVGIERTINDRLIIGAAGGWLGSSFLYEAGHNLDKLAASSKVGYLHSTYHLTNQLFIGAALNYGSTAIEGHNVRLLDIDKEALAHSQYDIDTWSGTAKLGYTKRLREIYDLTIHSGITHALIYDEPYTEKGADYLNFVVDAQRNTKTILNAGISLLANFDNITPEVHANIYRIIGTDEATKFGFEWLDSDTRFISGKPMLPKVQYNLGFNLGTNLTDSMYVEVGADAYFADKYQNFQGFVSAKYSF